MFYDTPIIEPLLIATVAAGASDLHLTPGRAPTMRVDGALEPVDGAGVLTARDTEHVVRAMLDDRQFAELGERQQLDLSLGLAGVGRFRLNVFRQRGTWAVAVRVIPTVIRSLVELGAPQTVTRLLTRPYGLVLVVGPTGSGKSTTLAAMVDHLNRTESCHILTLEDPVEFLHHHQRSMISQREVGVDVPTFADGLRAALREDPDVILLGELRDLDSIASSLTLAETGHLVLATLHTNDAAQTIDRLVDVFPAERRDQIQVQLAGSLQGIVSQRLLPGHGGGRVAAFEVLTATDAVRNLVREGKTRQLRNVIVSGGADGMQTLEADLVRLVGQGVVEMDVALEVTAHPKELRALLDPLRRSPGGVSGQGPAATRSPFGRL